MEHARARHRYPRYSRLQRPLRWLLTQGTSGQAVVYIALMLPLFVSLVGLAVDGGNVFSARRELQDVADTAARAGAMQIDREHYLSSAAVSLDAPAARRIVADYVADYASGAGGAGGAGRLRSLRLTGVDVGERSVVVAVGAEVPLTFLRLAGWQTVGVSARAPAEARYGIWEGR